MHERTPVEIRFCQKVDTKDPSGCWVWTGARSKAGYGQIRVDGKGGKAIYAHRYIWGLLNGVIPAGMDICHKCDNPPCVNPAHLFLGTEEDNMQDMMEKGRYGERKWTGHPGEKNPHHKLTAKQVVKIKEALRKNEPGTTKKLAAEYGVAYTTIYSIKRGDNWK